MLWLLGGAAAIALAWLLDVRVDAALSVAGRPALQKLAWWCSEAGEGWAVAAWGFLSAAIFFQLKRPDVAGKIFFVAATSEVAGLVSVILRGLVGRARPNALVPPGIYGLWHDGHWIVGRYDFSAFPSGHSAVAAGLAAAAWLFSPRWGKVAAVYALGVVWSRVAQGSHHLSDVVASIVIAIPIAVLMNTYFAPANEMFFEKLGDKTTAGKSVARKF
jgi:membrane-associated phospholipid phosphatase